MEKTINQTLEGGQDLDEPENTPLDTKVSCMGSLGPCGTMTGKQLLQLSERGDTQMRIKHKLRQKSLKKKRNNKETPKRWGLRTGWRPEPRLTWRLPPRSQVLVGQCFTEETRTKDQRRWPSLGVTMSKLQRTEHWLGTLLGSSQLPLASPATDWI